MCIQKGFLSQEELHSNGFLPLREDSVGERQLRWCLLRNHKKIKIAIQAIRHRNFVEQKQLGLQQMQYD